MRRGIAEKSRVILVFFVHKKYSRSFIKLQLNLMSHGLFFRCPCCVSGNISVALQSIKGLRALGFNQKYLNLCSEDERRSYWFGMTRE